MTKAAPKHTNLWAEVLSLVNTYAAGLIEKPKERLTEIKQQLGGSSSHIEDIDAIVRIADRAMGKYE